MCEREGVVLPPPIVISFRGRRTHGGGGLGLRSPAILVEKV